MNPPLWFYDVAVYSIQLVAMIAAGGVMAAATRLRLPRARLAYWRLLLAAGLLLPALEPWRIAPWAEQNIAQAGERAAQAGSIQIEATVAAAAQVRPWLSVYDWIALALAAGALLRLLWLAAGLMRLRRSRRAACPLGPHDAVEEFKSALGVAPVVLVSDKIVPPATFGWRKPIIVLPSKFVEMDAARQRAIFCHEFLHVQRRDWLWHIAEEIIRAIFWFHPPVAWLIGQARLSREQVVDREVVALTGSRRAYLDALYDIAAATSRARLAPAPLLLGERHLKRRVALILKEVPMSRKKLTLALSTSLAGFLLSGVVAVTFLPLLTSAAPAGRASQTQAGSASSASPVSNGQTATNDQATAAGETQKAAKQAKAAQEGAAKMEQAKTRRQAVEAEVAAAKANLARVQEQFAKEQAQLQAAEEALAKANQAESERQVKAAEEQAKLAQQEAAKVNLAEVQRQMAQANQAVERARAEQEAAAKANQAESQLQLKAVEEQTKLAQQEAAKINSNESQEAMERVKAAMKQAEEAEKKAEEKLKQATPSPPAAKSPPSAGISGGVTGAVKDGTSGGISGAVTGSLKDGTSGAVAGGIAGGPDLPSEGYNFEGKDYKFEGKVYKVGDGVQPPQFISKLDPEPPYTPEARKAKLSGIVVLSVVVSATGKVVEVKEVSKPLGLGLDESAIKTVRSWKFKPGTRNGAPVPVRVTTQITFRLN